jgi:hypothetical protein
LCGTKVLALHKVECGLVERMIPMVVEQLWTLNQLALVEQSNDKDSQSGYST